MAAKTANVIDRKAPNIKEQAEEIMDMHGIPVSLSGSGAPTARDELDDAAFHAMMEHGLKEAMMHGRSVGAAPLPMNWQRLFCPGRKQRRPAHLLHSRQRASRCRNRVVTASFCMRMVLPPG